MRVLVVYEFPNKKGGENKTGEKKGIRPISEEKACNFAVPSFPVTSSWQVHHDQITSVYFAVIDPSSSVYIARHFRHLSKAASFGFNRSLLILPHPVLSCRTTVSPILSHWIDGPGFEIGHPHLCVVVLPVRIHGTHRAGHIDREEKLLTGGA